MEQDRKNILKNMISSGDVTTGRLLDFLLIMVIVFLYLSFY